MILDDYAAYPTIVNGDRSGIQRGEGALSVCRAFRQGAFSGPPWRDPGLPLMNSHHLCLADF
jgi:hypothetical protein